MSKTDCSKEQLTFWKLGKQQVTADFSGGRVVSDAGLLAVRRMERGLGVLSELGRRLPDPRSQKFVTHNCERILVQGVYQILAGYFDYNDANDLRCDPLFQLLADVSPSDEQPLASGSTLARFQHAYTRREADRPREDRSTLFECRRAHVKRIEMVNEYFVELFVKTRRRPPKRVILDIDATDDETHGEQQLTLFHGHYGQYQYYPLLVFDGETGFPLGAWLRHGTAGASLGAAEEIERIVQALRAVWPDVEIIVRGDAGFATPEMYEVCERLTLKYAFGYSTNAVLRRRTELKQRYALALCELYDEKQQFFTRHRRLPSQRLAASQADHRQGGSDAAGHQSAVRRHQSRRFAGGNHSRLLRQARQRSRTADRPVEKRPERRPAFLAPFFGQRLEAAVSRVGLRHLRVVPGGERIGSRSRRQRGCHTPPAVVQSRSRCRNQRQADLDSLLRPLAASVAVRPHLRSR